MTRAEEQIREMLASEFESLEVTPPQDVAGLEIPGVHEDVGPLRVQIDSDEITVFVGPTHCHFTDYDDEPEAAHADAALQFIREVLSDQQVLWSCLGAGGAYPVESSRRFKVPWLVRRFVWSGPLKA